MNDDQIFLATLTASFWQAESDDILSQRELPRAFLTENVPSDLKGKFTASDPVTYRNNYG